MKTVWIYEDGDTLKMFDTEEEAQAWLEENDRKGVASECHVSELRPAGSADQYGVPIATE